jgi:RimJ/RimL family protein N-acetyltransferase
VVRLEFPIHTEHLLLRPFTRDDLEALQALHSREDVTRYLHWSPRTAEQTAELLGRIRRMMGFDGKRDALRLAGTLIETRELVADFSLWTTSREHHQGEIGFIVDPAHHGKGYGTEGAAVLLRIGFEHARFHRIVGRCDARNVASVRLMERLGMRREAHLRENELVKGEWTDELIYAMLQSEWPSAGVRRFRVRTP